MATARDPPSAWRLGVDLSRSFHSSLPVDRDRAGLALVRRALDAGISWVDCGGGAAVADVERRAATALAASPRGPEVRVSTTLSGEPRTESASPGDARPSLGRPRPLFEGRPEEWPRLVEEAVDRSAHRLARSRLSIVWIHGADAAGPAKAAVRRLLEEMCEEGGPIDSWGIRLTHLPTEPEAQDRVLALRAPHLAVPVHLLNAGDGIAGLAGTAAAAGTRVTATDPFADGLLDGSWFSSAGASTAPGPAGPPAWGQLRDRFEPVRRLGFLTADRRRTLPAAALQFLWSCPELTGVLVAPRDGTELNVALQASSSTPLTETERRRVLAGPTTTGGDDRRTTQIGGPPNRSV